MPSLCIGCETTSSFYSIGKLKVLKFLKESEKCYRRGFKYLVKTMSHKNNYVKLENNCKCGISSVNSRDNLKFIHFKSPRYVPVERMPPTKRLWFFYLLRIHLKVNTSRNLETKLPVERFVYQVVQGAIEPTITGMSVIPDELLCDIRCSFQKKNCAVLNLHYSANADPFAWMKVPLKFLNLIQSSTPFTHMTLLLLLRTLIKSMGIYFDICTYICVFFLKQNILEVKYK